MLIINQAEHTLSQKWNVVFTQQVKQLHLHRQSVTYTTRQDWFDNQKIAVNNGVTIDWNTLADRPGTSVYAEDKGARFDEVHVVVFDADGDVTGNAGTILEKHFALSKASDADLFCWCSFILEKVYCRKF